MTNHQENDAGSENSVVKPSRLADRKKTPPWYVWAYWLAAAGYIASLYVRDAGMDTGFNNVATYIALGTSVGILWSWLGFFSGYSTRFRRRMIMVPVLGVLAFLACSRIMRTSGTVVPEFAWRWSRNPDQLLPKAVAEEGLDLVDMVTTTEDDFPQFLGPNRSAGIVGVELSRDWTAHPPRQVWRQPIGAGWSAFACVNQFAVTMEQRGKQELVTCLEVGTGKLRWSHAVEARHATIPGFVGPRATPTINGGMVFALGATGIFRCLDGQDGTRVWQRNLLADQGLDEISDAAGVSWGRSGSPLVIHEKVIVPVGGAELGPWVALAAFHRETGEMIWEGGDYQAAYASPMLYEFNGVPQILSVNENYLSSHDVETGEVLWDHDWPGVSSMDANVSQPIALSGNRVLLTKGYGVGAELIQLVQEDDLWTVETLAANNRVMKTKFTNLVLKDGYAYGLDDGFLSCMKVASLQRQWKRGRYGQGQILMVGDVILILAEDGRLAMVEANPEQYVPLGEIQALEGQTWNNLCLTGRMLLVRNAEEAACYELPVSISASHDG